MTESEMLFIATVKTFYTEQGRNDLPWRVEKTPFNAFLSEIMLQQTQVPRVIEKFKQFRQRFSSFEMLAEAPQSEIVALWQGLGYNRRAIFLHKSAQYIMSHFNGVLPKDPEKLVKLPGIGPATASSIAVYAYNEPFVFIETNIRAVFIHHFFNDRNDVHDEELVPLIESTLDRIDPYHWYSALMDYGTLLKSAHKNPARKSRHHVKQSTFKGSQREIRGKIIRLITELTQVRLDSLKKFIDDKRFDQVVEALIRENFVKERKGSLFLK